MMRSEDGTRLLSIGKLGEVINRKPDTIRTYHRNGVIPELKHFDSRGWRLYTFYQARLLQRAFTAFEAGKYKSLAEVAEFIHKEWDSG
jgi:DNA-binding transcriptional MerR regulator